ncbi:uncharacterized protein LOC111041585 [Myzus persicae]|uniref:uncharacterized protein LOC111041585 n=1 Tax=Myzus persicae TaxID=13164 RepID=UPI000B935A4E|nr:uncharacterized protein LOC111041585 [Myzus persicae]
MISKIIPEVCVALIEVLKTYVKWIPSQVSNRSKLLNISKYLKGWFRDQLQYGILRKYDVRILMLPSYVFVGDEAFPLKPYLLRPYSRNSLGDNEPNTIFNYRLSRTRRVVENAFGILAARWRCFRGHIEVQPEFVDKIVLASCCLHNMLCTNNEFEPDLDTNQVPENAFLNIDALRRNSTREATQIRDAFKDYFNSDAGSVVWQVDSVRKGRIHT